MEWQSTRTQYGTWFWWTKLPHEWTAWVIDDSCRRGTKTEYRLGVSARSVTFFPHRRYQDFREAKHAAILLALDMQSFPLNERVGHFSRSC